MSNNTYPLKLPASIKAAAQRLAKEDGVSLNQWIASAVAQRIGVVETAADFLKHRGNGATGDRLLEILDQVPDNTPMEDDELPEGWGTAALNYRK